MATVLPCSDLEADWGLRPDEVAARAAGRLSRTSSCSPFCSDFSCWAIDIVFPSILKRCGRGGVPPESPKKPKEANGVAATKYAAIYL
jgi:hypothetical protein